MREKIEVIADDELSRLERRKAKEENERLVRNVLDPKDSLIKDLEIEKKKRRIGTFEKSL